MIYRIEDLIKLLNIHQIGSTRLRNLVSYFGSTEGVLNASFKELKSVPGIDENIAKCIKNQKDDVFVKNQIKAVKEHNVRIVTFWDEEYPYNLKKINDPPVLIYIKGNFLNKDKYSISIVGTRTPTEYGKIIAEKFSKELVSLGLTVISGLARGVDSAAHRGAINGGGRTIGVLGSALNRIYPPENLKLARKVMESGALISEFPMGTGPDRENFPRRNRIISGMSLGTLVVEGRKDSGAIITADFAFSQKRKVFAVPGSIDNPKSEGPHFLIKKGAVLVQSVNDILEELEPELKGLQTKIDLPEVKIELSEGEEKILNLLSREPIHIDVICKKGNFTSSSALSLLLSLELKGLVKQLPGKMFIRY